MWHRIRYERRGREESKAHTEPDDIAEEEPKSRKGKVLLEAKKIHVLQEQIEHVNMTLRRCCAR